MTKLLFFLFFLTGPEEAKQDTIRLLPNACIVFNNDTLYIGRTSLREFQQMLSINDSLPELQKSTWDGTSVNFSTGESKAIGGMEYIQRVPHKDLQWVFKSTNSQPDSLILESLTFTPKSPCDMKEINTVLFFATENISSKNPHKAMGRLLSNDSQYDSRTQHKSSMYYTFDRYGFIFHLLKCGNSYRIEKVLVRKPQ